ncbi:PREDICTED: neuronal acetylcholine receptor subunit alpha-10-like [Branchiostoma belcheri]|uniref:Neuronal acetylcholine receptor subunit alpha-10-like n=1 Tax=Branchiostoma belcheri TaxID=7741 RepID=A0A6P4YCK6_BRABE|nr:PREDICTED: neuronal acetylcholine receptor subunit alpha-10-like [Branchiostoma belcheri]
MAGFHAVVTTYTTVAMCLALGAALNITTENSLRRFLMTDYSPGVRPKINSTEAIAVYLDVALHQIIEVVSKSQLLITNLRVKQYWRDEYLVWDPDVFNGLSKIRIPSEQIWRPDIYLFNRQQEEEVVIPDTWAELNHTGHVKWTYIITMRSTCLQRLLGFPNDEQICPLQFGSWTNDNQALELYNMSSVGDITDTVQNEEWELVSMVAERNVILYNCCPHPYVDVMYYIKIVRRPLYYYYYFVSPCVIIMVLTLMGFLLPPDCEEKLSLSITMLLSVVFYLQLLAEKLPPDSHDVPVLGQFYAAILVIVGLSAFVTAATLNFHFPEPNIKPVPDWLRRIALGDRPRPTPGLVLYPRDDIDDVIRRNSVASGVDSETGEATVNQCKGQHNSANEQSWSKTPSSNGVKRHKMFSYHRMRETYIGSEVTNRGRPLPPLDLEKPLRHQKRKRNKSQRRSSKRLKRMLEVLQRRLDVMTELYREIVRRKRRKDLQAAIQYEWKLVGVFADRCLLVIFLLVCVTTLPPILIRY